MIEVGGGGWRTAAGRAMGLPGRVAFGDRVAGVVACLGVLPVMLAAVAAGQGDMVVYDDARQNGWQDYGWATINYDNTAPVHGGTRSISVRDPTTSYQALYLHHGAFDNSLYQGLRFWVYPTTSRVNQLGVRATLLGAAQAQVKLSFTGGQVNNWQQVTIPLADLGVAGRADFDGFWIQNITGAALATFYVDDISLVAAPPPEVVQVGVDAGSAIRVIDERLYGINLAMWDRHLAGGASADLLAAMDLRAVRFPGGSLSDDYDWHTDRGISNGGTFQWVNHAATFARVAEQRGAQGCVTVNYGSGTPEQAAAWVAYHNGSPAGTAALGTDSKGRDWKTVGFWATLRASAPLGTDDGYNFLRAAHPAPYGFRDWEVGNECYGSWEYDQHGTSGSGLAGVAHDPYTYAQAFQQFHDRMLAVDPTIRIGAVATEGEDLYGIGTHPATNPRTGATHTGWTPVMLATMKALGVTPHFLVHHFYAQNPGNESDSVLLQAGAGLGVNAAAIRGMITDYLGGSQGAGVEILLTELNSVSSNPGKQSTSLVNALFMADSFGHVARSEFNACMWWDFRNGAVTDANNSALLYGWRLFGDYGVVASGDVEGTPVNTPFPAFHCAQLLTHWGRGGDTVVSAGSNYPLLAVHAALLAAGDLALLVVNKSPTSDLAAQVTLENFTPGADTAPVWQYGTPHDLANGGLTESAVAGVGPAFLATFPAYSMSVVVVPGPLTYDRWRARQFTPGEAADEAVSGFAADCNRDGTANGLAYALGLDPKAPAGPGLPRSGVAVVDGRHYPTLEFTQLRGASDIVYVVEASADLATWESGAGHVVRTDDGSTDAAVYRWLTAEEDAPRGFMRLRVTRQ